MARKFAFLCVFMTHLYDLGSYNNNGVFANETMLPNNIRGMELDKKNNIEFSAEQLELINQLYDHQAPKQESPEEPIVEKIVNWVLHAPKHQKLIFFQRHGQSAANVWEFFAFRRQKSMIDTEKQLSFMDPELSTEGRAQCQKEGDKWRNIFENVRKSLGSDNTFCIDFFASSALTRCIQTEGITMNSIAEFGCDYNPSVLGRKKPELLLVPYLREHQDSIGEIGRPWQELQTKINDMKEGHRYPYDQEVDGTLIVDDWWLPNTKEEVLEYANAYKTKSRKERFADLMRDSSMHEANPGKVFAKALSQVFPSCKNPNYMLKRRELFDHLYANKPSYAPIPHEHPMLVKVRAHAVLDSLCAVDNGRIAVLAAHKNLLSSATQHVASPFGNAEIRPYSLDCQENTITAL